MKREVLILGGGLSAYAAAFEAEKEGAFVTLVSDGAGASPFIHAFSVTEGAGDSAALLFEDTLRAGCFQSDRRLAKTLAESAAGIPSFLDEIGLALDRDEKGVSLIQPLGSSVPRAAFVSGQTGPAVLKKLKARLSVSPLFREMKGVRAVDLITENGRVTGARFFDRERKTFFVRKASAVILATGGFCRLFPESTEPADLGGDGVAMAYRAGAELCDLEMIQFEPCSAVFPKALAGKSLITTLFYEGAVLRNGAGERFLLREGEEGEKRQKDVLSLLIAREIASGKGSAHGGVFFDCTGVPEERMTGFYAPYLKRYLSVGVDLRTTPVEVAPAAHTSLGGVCIDPACRTTLPGLFACGEVTGGLHGANRLGGNAGLETMVFGRIAGKEAARETVKFSEGETLFSPSFPPRLSTAPLRELLAQKLRAGLGVERRKDAISDALEWVRNALLLPFRESSFEECRLQNDLTVASLALQAALERPSSVGCHVRSDGVPEKERYSLHVKRINGTPCFEKKKIEVEE